MKLYFNRYYILAYCLSISMVSSAQDITNQTQFFINPYILNPSYAGAEGRPALFLSYRKQWTSIAGAPTISNFSFHGNTKGKANYGVNFNSDDRGIVNTSSALLTFGYTILLDEFTSIRFGISGGIGFNGVDVTRLGTFTDKILPSILNRNSFLMGNAGVSFQKKTFHGGIALPNLFQPVYISADPFAVSSLQPFQQVIVHASNRFYFDKDKNMFEPYLVYRLNGSGLPSQLEAAAVLHLQHVVWVGASYRQNYGVSGLGGFKIKNQLAVGFSYSIKNTGINELNSPTYELQIGFIPNPKKSSPTKVAAYSFLNTEKEKPHKKTARELAEEKKKHQLELAKKQNNLKKTPPLVVKPQPEPKRPVIVEKKIEPVVIAKKEIPVVTRPDTTHHEDVKVLQKLTDHAADPLAEHGLESDQHENHERHEIVRRGTHHEELDLGDFVVAGVFGKRENAEHFAAELTKLGFKPDFGYLTSKQRWYVYLFEGENFHEARMERDKYRKLSIFKDAWLLTVTEK
ncbi:MAG TPA: PorP/SprF family type IX secretion system membrane protein [Cyclobacteriaceae bacterium]|nr:PorP/SprF family type IX secretion system membrane protein [Cyclobacteriaceae bacterium]